MPRYKPVNLQQDTFVPIRFDKQILPGTFEYALHHLLEETFDLSAFDAKYANDDLGARAYHPRVLLKIVLFAYARGLIGSRRIERACRENVQFMALSGESKPDHATIAAFISRPPDAIQTVFREVLLVCDAAGLIGREHFAIDVVKRPSNASKDLSGRIDELQAKVNKLDRAIERMIKAHHMENTKDAKLKRGPNGKERKSNVTDNDSAKMKTGKGVNQGYTAVAVTDDKHQLFVEAQAHGAPEVQELLQPVLTDLQESFQDLGPSGNILAESKLTADSGFHSGKNLNWLNDQQCDAYIADNLFRKRDPRFADADKYKPPKPQPNRFRPSDFDYDPQRLTCTCPAGKTLYRNGPNVTIKGRTSIKFTAPKSACDDCHLRQAACVRPTRRHRVRLSSFASPRQPTRARLREPRIIRVSELFRHGSS